MNEQLMQRIQRRLEPLTDERGYQILDYVEFLESKYAARAAPSNLFAKISEGIEDTMRAARLPIKAIKSTTGLMDSAGKVMKGVAAAAQSVVDEVTQAAESPKQVAPEPAAPPKAVPPPTPGPKDAGQT